MSIIFQHLFLLPYFMNFINLLGLFGNVSSVNSTALHGAALIKARVPAGKSRTLPIIMSWYYPNRDITDERVGNYYTRKFKSSIDVASYIASHLTEQVQDIVRYQDSISPPKSIFPKVRNHLIFLNLIVLFHRLLLISIAYLNLRFNKIN